MLSHGSRLFQMKGEDDGRQAEHCGSWGGNGAFITAADLNLHGHRVSICEVPEFHRNIEGILKSRSIELQIVGNPGIKGGLAKLDTVTTDPKEALPDAEVVLMVLPAFGQKRFAEHAFLICMTVR